MDGIKEWKFPTPEEVRKALGNRLDLEVQGVLNDIIDTFNKTGEIAYHGRCMYKNVADGVASKLADSGWDCVVPEIGTYNGIPAFTIKQIRPKEKEKDTVEGTQ